MSSGVETMSHTQSLGRTAAGAPLRVRDQAREVVAVVLFSAVTATCLAVGLLLLASLGRRG
jgi:hypothetical protein